MPHASEILNSVAVKVLGAIVVVVSTFIGVQEWLNTNYVKKDIHDAYVEQTTEQNKTLEEIIEKHTIIRDKHDKDGKIFTLKFRQRILLSIPEHKRTDRDKIELDIIKLELDTLNAGED